MADDSLFFWDKNGPETLELVGVTPTPEETSMEVNPLEEEEVDAEGLELATLSSTEVASSVLGFWELEGYLWNLGLWRHPP